MWCCKQAEDQGVSAHACNVLGGKHGVSKTQGNCLLMALNYNCDCRMLLHVFLADLVNVIIIICYDMPVLDKRVVLNFSYET